MKRSERTFSFSPPSRRTSAARWWCAARGPPSFATSQLDDDHSLIDQLRQNARGVDARHSREREQVFERRGAVDLGQHEARAVVEVEPDDLGLFELHPGNAPQVADLRLVHPLQRGLALF